MFIDNNTLIERNNSLDIVRASDCLEPFLSPIVVVYLCVRHHHLPSTILYKWTIKPVKNANTTARNKYLFPCTVYLLCMALMSTTSWNLFINSLSSRHVVNMITRVIESYNLIYLNLKAERKNHHRPVVTSNACPSRRRTPTCSYYI